MLAEAVAAPEVSTLLTHIIALVALTLMEIVLGIDNIVFISVVTSRLPEKDQPSARRIGLAAAMGTRILLLLTIVWIMKLTQAAFALDALPFGRRSRTATTMDAASNANAFRAWSSVTKIATRLGR